MKTDLLGLEVRQEHRLWASWRFQLCSVGFIGSFGRVLGLRKEQGPNLGDGASNFVDDIPYRFQKQMMSQKRDLVLDSSFPEGMILRRIQNVSKKASVRVSQE
jgi:hypothetical protein